MALKTVKLKSGHRMPVLGLGTWRLSGGLCELVVKKAIGMGYRHIDTAELYGNEVEIGRAIRGFDREEIFITSKAWRTNLAHDDIIRACEGSLEQLGTSYIDLYLIHWPNPAFPLSETLEAMGELVQRGMIRSAGVSNFNPKEMREAVRLSRVPVCVNQVEFHPYLYQPDILEACRKLGIVLTAYCPVARGHVMEDSVLAEIGNKYGKTPAQVSLRWLVQHGAVVIPKSTNDGHLRENMDIFDWHLSEGDMKKINSIDIRKRQVNPIFTSVPYFVAKAFNRLC